VVNFIGGGNSKKITDLAYKSDNFYHIMEHFKVRLRDNKKQNKKVFLVFSSFTII
jgi:hypothetical protein